MTPSRQGKWAVHRTPSTSKATQGFRKRNETLNARMQLTTSRMLTKSTGKTSNSRMTTGHGDKSWGIKTNNNTENTRRGFSRSGIRLFGPGSPDRKLWGEQLNKLKQYLINGNKAGATKTQSSGSPQKQKQYRYTEKLSYLYILQEEGENGGGLRIHNRMIHVPHRNTNNFNCINGNRNSKHQRKHEISSST